MNHKFKPYLKVAGLALISVFCLSDLTVAHPGRVNSSGCHTDKSTGNYHCHNNSGGGSNRNTGGSNRNTGNRNSTNNNRTSTGSNRNYVPLTVENLSSCSISIKVGMRGEAVGAVQKYLAQLNYLPMNAPDGVFGQQTEAAVIKYQQEKDLTPDGIVGCQTFAALKKDVEEKN